MKMPPYALNVAPSSELPESFPGTGTQTVRTIRSTSEGIIIDTDQGTWTFHPTERCHFPRREPFQTKDWVGSSPRLSSLAHGDQLDPALYQTEDPRFDDDWSTVPPEDQEIEMGAFRQAVKLKGNAQTVVSVTRDLQTGLYRLNTTDYNGPHVYLFSSMLDHVQFPHADAYLPPMRSKERTPVPVQSFGPYRWHGDPDSEPVFFAVHPYGRGRWPADIARYKPNGSGVMQPPKSTQPPRREWNQGGSYSPTVDEWSQWELDESAPNAKRHPKDPIIAPKRVRSDQSKDPYA